jgi:hypothetical protein
MDRGRHGLLVVGRLVACLVVTAICWASAVGRNSGRRLGLPETKALAAQIAESGSQRLAAQPNTGAPSPTWATPAGEGCHGDGDLPALWC